MLFIMTLTNIFETLAIVPTIVSVTLAILFFPMLAKVFDFFQCGSKQRFLNVVYNFLKL